jgi:hypothetical protein
MYRIRPSVSNATIYSSSSYATRYWLFALRSTAIDVELALPHEVNRDDRVRPPFGLDDFSTNRAGVSYGRAGLERSNL